MTVSDWYSFFQLGSVVALFLTFAFGAGAIIAGLRVNKESAREALDLKAQIAESSREAEQIKADAANAKRESDEKIAQLNHQTATLSADAEQSRKSVAEAHREAAEASAKAEGFRLDIAKANERAASANEAAEREKLARLQLEAKLAPRTLTEEQKNRITAVLSRFNGIVADLVLFGDSFEIQDFGNSLLGCLQKAGWTATAKMALGGGGSTRGVPIGVRADADTNTKRAAATLIATLISMGIVSGSWDFEQMQMPTAFLGQPTGGPAAPIRVFVGTKP